MTLQEALNSVWASSQPFVVNTCIALVSLAGAWLLKQIAAHVPNATAAAILQRAVGAVQTCVLSAEQTVVSDLTSKGVPLSKQAGLDIRNDVLAKAKTLLGPSGLAAFSKIVGPANLDAMLIQMIEAEVSKLSPSTQKGAS